MSILGPKIISSCIQLVIGKGPVLISDRTLTILTEIFCGFNFILENARRMLLLKSLPLPSPFLQIHCSLIIVSLDEVWFVLLSAS
jgi:hypothetical protein